MKLPYTYLRLVSFAVLFYIFSFGVSQNTQNLSVIDVPINIQVSTLQDLLNRELLTSETIGRDPGCNTGAWGQIERGAIGLRIEGNSIFWSLPVTARAQGRAAKNIGWPIGCVRETKSCTMQFTILVKTDFSIDNTWNLITNTQFQRINWRQRCRINLLGIEIGVTSFFEDTLNQELRSNASKLDTEIRDQFNLRSELNSLWLDVQDPINIDSNLWLNLKPQNLHLANLSGNEGVLQTRIKMTALPRVSSERPVQTNKSNLPNMTNIQTNNGISLHLPFQINYSALNTMLHDIVSPEVQRYLGTGFILNISEISASNEMLVVKLALSGTISASLNLYLKPRIESSTNTLFLDHIGLDFNNQSQTSLSEYNLDGFKNSLQVKTQIPFPLDSEFQRVRGKLQEAINQPINGISPQGNIQSVGLKSIEIREDSLVASAYAYGNISLNITDIR